MAKNIAEFRITWFGYIVIGLIGLGFFSVSITLAVILPKSIFNSSNSPNVTTTCTIKPIDQYQQLNDTIIDSHRNSPQIITTCNQTRTDECIGLCNNDSKCLATVRQANNVSTCYIYYKFNSSDTLYSPGDSVFVRLTECL